MLSDAQVHQFQQDGFLAGPQVLDSEQVDELRGEVERIIRDRENPAARQPVMVHNMSRKADGVVWQIVNIWEASDPFRALIENPIITSAVAQLCDSKTLRIWHDQIQFKTAGGGGQNDWHQDIPYWPVLQTNNMLTAWVALDDVDEENGCMSMVPGSHAWGNQINFLHTLKGLAFDEFPSTLDGHPIRVQRAPVAKGQVHYHHSLTWHGSHTNRSNRPRRAIALHYLTDQTRFNAGATHVMDKFIESADGAVVAGERFPIVWPATAHSSRGVHEPVA